MRNMASASLQTAWYIKEVLLVFSAMLVATIKGTDPTPPSPPSNISEIEFMERLLTNYSRFGRPGPINVPVEVSLGLHLLNLDEFRWKDESLRWNETDVGTHALSVPADRLWRPDIVVGNSMSDVYGDVMDKDKHFMSRIFADGTVELLTAGKMSSACIVDMTYFPLDQQACSIIFESWTYSSKEVQLVEFSDRGPALRMDTYRPNGEWNVIRYYTEMRRIYYNTSEQKFDQIEFVLELKRKPMFYLLSILAPCVIMSVMVLFVFLLPADSGEKVSLCITLFLAYSVFQLVVSDQMPPNSDRCPILAVYFTASMILAALSLLATLVVLHMHHHGLRHRPPSWLRRMLNSRLPAILYLPPPPISLKLKTDSDEFANCGRKSMAEIRHVTHEATYERPNGVRREMARKTADGDLGKLQIELAQLQHLENLGGGVGDGEVKREEWVYVARVMDRMFLVVFTIATILVIVVCIGFVPLSQPAHVTPVKVF